jgi:tripartite-type tricarboxylate transporter receptor subunit TctC
MQHGLLKIASFVACALFAQTASADPVADFFHGQTITIIVGSDPGGGYDAYARPVSRHLGRLIPGEPSVVVKYMPGAASIVAANYLYNSAPRDGLTIGAVQRQIPFEPLRGNDAARYDPFKFDWLGSVTAETSVFIVWNTAPQKVAADILTQPMIAANLGAGTDSEVETTAMIRLMHAPINLISGYKGTPDALLAMERGEVQGLHGISWSYVKTKKADWLHDGKIRLLLQSGLKPHPDLPQVPSIYDLVKSDADRQVWDLIMAPKVMSRPFVLPPGVPAERAAALHHAFDALMKDPAFLADMDKMQLEVIPTSGEDIVALARRLYAFPPDTIARMRSAIALGAPAAR